MFKKILKDLLLGKYSSSYRRRHHGKRHYTSSHHHRHHSHHGHRHYGMKHKSHSIFSSIFSS
ncbi:MAG: hypothetical protein ACRC5C_15165 [Bacilli bacterium]